MGNFAENLNLGKLVLPLSIWNTYTNPVEDLKKPLNGGV